MRKVLIVEDDINFRFAIKEMIPWKENGFEIVGEAIHGKQALEILKKQQVDLVLTDMDMPQMNGVELTREVKKRYPQVAIVGLSAYDEFQFVKESMKWGARDYILKQEMNEQNVIQVLLGICREMEKGLEEKRENGRRSSDFLMLLKGEEIPQSSRTYFENLLLKKSFVLILAMDQVGKEVNSLLETWERDSKNQRGEILYQAEDRTGGRYVLKQIHETRSLAKQWEEIHSASDEIPSEGICSFISMPGTTLEDLQTLYAQVKILEEVQIYYPDKERLFYMEEQSSLQRREKNYEYQLSEKADLEDLTSMLRELQKMYDCMVKKMPEKEKLWHAFSRFYIECGKAQRFPKENEIAYYDGLKSLFYVDDMMAYTKEKLCQEMENRKRGYQGERKEIQKAVSYIWRHYPEDISLKVISELVGLSENYFSNLFKSEMKCSLTQYINQVRIENAKRLMSATDLKMYEIAERTGYKNITYFSTMFKRLTGIAASDYKNSPDDHICKF